VYDIDASGDGVEARVRTSNLGYASELTRLLLQSTPAAFVPTPTPPLPPAVEAALEVIGTADVEDGVSQPMSHDEAVSR
jgi:hypothetical protein